jgi:colanic acid biosynthesis glycosyl transferase WcaI
VDVLRSRVLIPRRGSAVSRILYDTSLCIGSLINSTRMTPADLVLCVTPPVQLGLVGALLARRWRVPLVLLLKDLPIDLALAVGMMRAGRAHDLGRQLERTVYGMADKIIVISDGFCASLLRQGVPAAKIAIIPDWANTNAIQPLAPEPDIRELLGAGPDDFLVLHTGNMGEKQGLPLAVTAAGLPDCPPSFRLTLIGDGSDRARIEEIVADQRLANVRLVPLQPVDLFPRLLAAADALLLNQRTNVTNSVAPSKLWSYMAAGRSVLAAVHPDSETAGVIRKADCGVLVAPDEPQQLAAAAARLAADPVVRARLGANGRRYVEEHYARDRVLARYEAFLMQTVNAAPDASLAEPAPR